MVPEPVNPHETKSVEDMDKSHPDFHPLRRGAIRFALAIAIHKFPEGLAVFAASLGGLELGIPVAIAMALHNVPEGIAVSVPVYYATGNRRKAFLYASLTGLADPAGAVLGYLLLAPFLTTAVLYTIYAAVAGVMVFVTFDGLLPMAQKYGEPPPVAVRTGGGDVRDGAGPRDRLKNKIKNYNKKNRRQRRRRYRLLAGLFLEKKAAQPAA